MGMSNTGVPTKRRRSRHRSRIQSEVFAAGCGRTAPTPGTRPTVDWAGAIACVSISRWIIQKSAENKLALERADSVVHAGKQKAGGIASTRLMRTDFALRLELLGEAHVPVTVTDRVKRRIIVVVKRSENRWRVTIEDVVDADRQLGPPQPPLPYRGRRGFGHRRVLAVLGFLHVRSGFRWRLDPLVAQLHVERNVARHGAPPARIQGPERTEKDVVIAEVADVVTRGNEVEVMPLPLAAKETLVP